jgi:hypothetical protein
MGQVYADIELINQADEIRCEDGYLVKDQIRAMAVTAIADTGATRLSINETIQAQLGLSTKTESKVILADGRVMWLPVACAIRIRFKDRDCVTDAFVLPGTETPYLGAIPMELMDLEVRLDSQTLICNPAHLDGLIYIP